MTAHRCEHCGTEYRSASRCRRHVRRELEHATRTLESSVLSEAELAELQRHEDAKAVRTARDSLIRKRRARPERRAKASAIRARRARDAAEAEALRARPPGPRLPRWRMHNPRVYVVADDVAELGTVGWFDANRAELERRGAAVDMTGPEYALVLVHVWAARLGAGLQAPVAELAGVVGISRSWAYELVTRLEERGVLDRRRRLRRYANVARDLDTYTDAHGVQRPFKRWRDAGGELRTFVDLHAVTYATPVALELVFNLDHATAREHVKAWRDQGGRLRRARARIAGPPLELEAWNALWTTLRRSSRAVRQRLAPATEKDRTPYAVETQQITNLLRGLKERLWETGPPERGRGRQTAT